MSLNPPHGSGINILSGGGGSPGILPLIGYLALGYFNVLGGFIPWLGVSVFASAWLGATLGAVLSGKATLTNAWAGANLSLAAIAWGVITAFTGNILYGMIGSLALVFLMGMKVY